jgi:hypothetical protein
VKPEAGPNNISNSVHTSNKANRIADTNRRRNGVWKFLLI